MRKKTSTTQDSSLQGKRFSRHVLRVAMSSIVLLCGICGETLFFMNLYSSSAQAAPADTAVVTYKGNNQRTGNFSNETVLNTSNVNATNFGKRVSYPVDGQVYAQPLYVSNLTINGTTHNVVFVETEHDSVYAFDADATSTAAPLWHTSFLGNGVNSVTSSDVSCNDMVPEIGITGTPVIDSSTNTMYLVAYTQENSGLVYRLHALNITTGLDVTSPVVLQGSVPGTAEEAVNGEVSFNAGKERQRGALTMVDGQIYIPFGSFCDDGPYHGWIMGYTYGASALKQAEIYNSSPNGSGGGLWGGGVITADANGNIYFSSGNGDFDLNTGGTEASDAFVKLNAQLQMQDYFSPFNQSCLQAVDEDLGSGGPVIIPSLNEQIGGGKEGRIYVMNNSNMGKYTIDPNLNCATTEHNRYDIDNVMQESPPSTVGGIYSTPAYWNNTVYFAGAGDHAKAFAVNSNGLLNLTPTSETATSFGYTGGNPVISSNGNSNGILWTIDPSAILRAYDATNLATELYGSDQNAARDSLDNYVKFSSVTVANGEVFVGTQDSLYIYSLNPPPAPATTPTPTATPGATYNNIGISNDSAPSAGNFDGSGNSYSETALQSVGINPGDNAFCDPGATPACNPGGSTSDGKIVFAWPNESPGQADNYIANGQTLPVTPLTNASVVAFAGAGTGGAASGTVIVNYSDGTAQYATLTLSDWHLNGGLASGNAAMATMPYNNTATGQSSTTTSVFCAVVSLQAGKTVKSVTLPAAVTGGTMHIFAVATNQGPPPAAVYNNIGTSDDTNPGFGNFDGTNSYSAQALAAVGITPCGTVTFNGVNFTWPTPGSGAANNYIANGQELTITPVNGATTLAFLGAASGGTASGPATINYADGTTQSFTLGFSDWTLGGGTVAPSFGNQVVVTTAYRNTPLNGPDPSSKPVVLYADVALETGETIQSVVFPSIVNGGQLHIFTVATKGGTTVTATPTPTVTATPTATTAIYNNVDTSDDSNPSAGNFDGTNSYSAQALQAVGITPGGTVAFNGVNFTWPTPGSGAVNNYVANGQTIAVTPVSAATTLAFLGAASSGSASGTATITYTDGSTQTFTLGFSDWTLGGAGTDAPSFGNLVVATTAYRNTPAGTQAAHKPVVLYADVTLQSGKTLKSVTFPATVTGGQLHVFAVATN